MTERRFEKRGEEAIYLGARFIKVAVIYFVLGTVIGLVMGATSLLGYTSAHAHVNLVGWASLAVIGLIYKAYPEAGETKLANTQFWLHNIGLPILILSMIFFPNDMENLGIPFAAVGGLLVIASTVVMAVNVFKKVS